MRIWLIAAVVGAGLLPVSPAAAVPTATQDAIRAYCRAVGGTFWHYDDLAWGCARRCPIDKARTCGHICVADQGCELMDEQARYTKVRPQDFRAPKR